MSRKNKNLGDMILELFIIIIVLAVVVILYKNNKKKKLLSNPEVQLEIRQSKEFLASIKEAKKDYFRNSYKEKLKEEYKNLYEKFTSRMYKDLSNDLSVKGFIKTYSDLDALVKEWNQNYINQELTSNSILFDNIDGKSLDEQQRKAVVVDEDNNLILAGAGSGKTLTVSAKVKYLVDKKDINPEEILLISFTRKAAEEMQERITNRLKINVEAKTFHKLGLDIVSQARGKRPDVFDELTNMVDIYFKEEISNDKIAIKNIIDFFGYYLNIPKDLEEFNNLGEAYEYNKNSDFETIKSKIESMTDDLRNNRLTIQGEKVKSLEEVMIANFLYLNGVKYSYEKEYPYETGNVYRKQYRPDFYLEEYDIYLEHFGITKDNRTPWLSKIEEKKYLEGITWKRNIHKEKGTKLIETYSYFNKNGTLLSELDKLLKSRRIKYKEVNYKEIYNKLFSKKEDKYFKEFKKLVQTFIGLYKSRGFLEDDFLALKRVASEISNSFMKQRTHLFLSIVEPLFTRYQSLLKESGQIDFNDMINLATEIIKSGKVSLRLKYIIVDEYQDISVGRFNLIKELKTKTNARVMAVGDDWQSVYRFTGSDIDLFTSFSKYLGYSELLKIERTYRNSQELIDIAGKFIMKNPKQLKKNLLSDKHYSTPIRMFGYDRKIDIAVKNAIDEIVYSYGKDAEIMILGRNNFDIDALEKNEEFKIIKRQSSVTVKYNKYPELKLFFLTVHRSKGLEADNVLIINLENKLVGFPNKISDDPVLSLVLTDLDSFDFAEERRLFYVALTRTKNSTYLIMPDRNQSTFADELIKAHNIKYSVLTGEISIKDNPNCPFCQKGYLVIRENERNRSRFLGCTNYPQCNKTLSHIELLNGYIRCHVCGGYMVKRNGHYGEFYGCTNYPDCENKLRIDEGRKVGSNRW